MPEKKPSTRGEKVSDYLPKDIVIMAHLLLVTRPQEFVDRAKASAIVKHKDSNLGPAD